MVFFLSPPKDGTKRAANLWTTRRAFSPWDHTICGDSFSSSEVLIPPNTQKMPPKRWEQHLWIVFSPLLCAHPLFRLLFILWCNHLKIINVWSFQGNRWPKCGLLRSLYSEERLNSRQSEPLPHTFSFTDCSLIGGEVWSCLAKNVGKKHGILVTLRRYGQVPSLCFPCLFSLEA